MASSPCLSWGKPVLKTATASITIRGRPFFNHYPIFCWHYPRISPKQPIFILLFAIFIGLSDKNLKIVPSFAD